MKSRWWLGHSNESGSVAVAGALAFLMLIGVAAIVIDLGHSYVVHRDLQKAAEAGAYAGAVALTPPAGQQTWQWDTGKSTATSTVQLNYADTLKLSDFNTDASLLKVQSGYWDVTWTKDTAPQNLKGYLDPASYTPGSHDVAAVKVTVAKSSSGTGSGGPIHTFLASIWGEDFQTANMQSSAVAIRRVLTTIAPGDAFPFAIPYSFVNDNWYKNPPVSFTVTSNTQDSTSGGQWTTFLTTDNSASYITGLIDNGNPTSLSVGDNIYMQNGERSSIYNTALSQYLANPDKIYMVAVVQDGFVNGAYTQVLAYVPYKITGCTGSGSNPSVTGQFVPGYVDPNATGTNGILFGDPLPPVLVN